MIAAPRLPTCRDEGVRVPVGVVDLVLQRRAARRWRSGSPDTSSGEWLPHTISLSMSADGHAGLRGELRQRAVVVEAQHRGEVLRRQVRRRLHRDVGIGVGRVADHQHLDVARGDIVQRLALRGEDLRVLEQQVLALHARAARTRADQQRDVGVLERDARIIRADHAGEQRERAVLELHHHALERGLGLLQRQFEHLQDDRLVLAEHFAGGDAEQQGIADLAGGAGDGNTDGLFHCVTPGNRMRCVARSVQVTAVPRRTPGCARRPGASCGVGQV